jgi:hyaluronan synthase
MNLIELFEWFSIAYVTLSVSHFFVQFLFAHLNFVNKSKRNKSALFDKYGQNLEALPVTEIIFPIYNETPTIMRQVINAAKDCLLIPNLSITLIDDGSTNQDQLRPVYNEASKLGFRVIYKENTGKRETQHLAFIKSKAQYMITTDSDTIINKDSVLKIIYDIDSDPKIGAVTGDVKLANANHNILTFLQSLRYWFAFNLERAAQSYSGTMLCCPGCFSIYRLSSVKEVAEQYISQTFLGQKCTYGDDRHLTNLIISKGHKTMYSDDVYSYTHAPEKFGQFMNQQTRWNKSFFREFFWTLKFWNKVSFYSLYDVVIQPVLFLLLIMAISLNIFYFLNNWNILVLVYYVFLIIIMASIRGFYGVLRTFNPKFILFGLYGFVHLFVLLPIRLRALLTLSNTSWLTRGKKGNDYLTFAVWAVILTSIIGILNLILIFGSGRSDILYNIRDFKPFSFTFDWPSLVDRVFRYIPFVLVLSLTLTLLFSIFSLFSSLKYTKKNYKLQLGILSFISIFVLLVQIPSYLKNESIKNPYLAVVSGNRTEAKFGDSLGLGFSSPKVAGIKTVKPEPKPVIKEVSQVKNTEFRYQISTTNLSLGDSINEAIKRYEKDKEKSYTDAQRKWIIERIKYRKIFEIKNNLLTIKMDALDDLDKELKKLKIE